MSTDQLNICQVPIMELNPDPYNPRTWDEAALNQLQESLKRFGFVDPVIVNGAPDRKNVVIGGHMRLEAAKKLGLTEVPAVYVTIPDFAKEKELNIRLNKNTGTWNFELLREFDTTLLADIGFSSEELDSIFDLDLDVPETFDLQKELAKLDIHNIDVQKGDAYA